MPLIGTVASGFDLPPLTVGYLVVAGGAGTGAKGLKVTIFHTKS